MSASTILFAGGCFSVFGVLAVAMGRSAVGDTRKDRQAGRYGEFLLNTSRQWIAAAICAVVAVAGPVIILANG